MDTTEPRAALQDVSLDLNVVNAAAASEPCMKPPLMQRSKSDIASGLSRVALAGTDLGCSYSEEELQAHYERFKSYDLDDSGFVEPENLKAILTALDIAVTDEQVANMIEEVAILSGHENDGKLSFRDYIRCMEYEAHREAHNVSLDAAFERLSEAEVAPAEVTAAEPKLEAEAEAEAARAMVAEPEPEAEQPKPQAEQPEQAEQQQQQRMRRSSFATLDLITRGRITRFEQVIQETVKVNKVDDAAARRQIRFASKLAKFEAPLGANATVAQQESMYKKSVTDKLQAFEAAHRAATTTGGDLRKTWKRVGTCNWQAKKQINGGPPPKRSILDLP